MADVLAVTSNERKYEKQKAVFDKLSPGPGLQGQNDNVAGGVGEKLRTVCVKHVGSYGDLSWLQKQKPAQ